MRTYFFLLLSAICVFLLPAYVSAESKICAQVIQYAQNVSTEECQAFPTPCDVPSGWTPVKSCTLPTKKTVAPRFQAEKFASCEDMESRIVSIFEKYQDRYWYPYQPALLRSDLAEVVSTREKSADASIAPTASPGVGGATTPVSTTNTQVIGVDEADSVKTDGKNIFTYSQESSEVRIVRIGDLVLENTIRLPESFSTVEIYVSGKKLILVGQKYVTSGTYWTSRWYAPDMKSIALVYDISNVSKPVLERYNQIDGSYRDSRLIGNTLYFVSSNDLRFPPVYMTPYVKNANGFSQSLSDLKKNFSIKTLAPEIRESTLNAKGKYTQSIRTSVANCSDVTFVLPSDTTLKNIDFTPAFVSLSSLDITKPTTKMKSELVFGDVSQIHMSKNALYITSVISQTNTSTCPLNAKCFAPIYRGNVNSTLIHKYTLQNGGLSYQYSTSVSGNPMNQYSMDEDASGNFRIVTQNYAWSSEGDKNTTALSVISPFGKIIGKLENIAPGESFQSSRFIGDRLYLVTFEQIDPLFVISVADPASPKILGELKMPGYSTYLHPYDADRLIGLGYDTKTNEWGGTQNDGLKIDLYNVSDVKNPRQEASFVLGDAGSSSDVLTNPRAFVWYKEKNLLLLPATLMMSANDPSDSYRSQSAFQGIIGISILPKSIIEKFRVTHVSLDATTEEKWKDDCSGYLGKKQTCQRLLDGSEYCGGGYSYVPPYCYAGSTVATYFASQMWEYQRDFITRALYVGETFYSIAEGGVKSWSFSNTTNPKASITFTTKTTKPVYPVPMMAK